MDYAYGDFNGTIKLVSSPSEIESSFSTSNGLITHMESILGYNQKSYIVSATLNDSITNVVVPRERKLLTSLAFAPIPTDPK